jgi:hypothetical protein
MSDSVINSIAIYILMRVTKFLCRSVAGSLKFRCRPAPINHRQGVDSAKIFPMERTIFESDIEFFPAVRESDTLSEGYRAAAAAGRMG